MRGSLVRRPTHPNGDRTAVPYGSLIDLRSRVTEAGAGEWLEQCLQNFQSGEDGSMETREQDQPVRKQRPMQPSRGRADKACTWTRTRRGGVVEAKAEEEEAAELSFST